MKAEHQKEAPVIYSDKAFAMQDIPAGGHPEHGRDIDIWVQKYDDIFSKFDPRPYSERLLSEDFIRELKRVCRESDEHINCLRLLVAPSIRNEINEVVISKRLHFHFKRGYSKIHQEVRKARRRSVLMIAAGLLSVMVATYINTKKSGNVLLSLLLVVLEPAGWFLVWTSFDQFYAVSTSMHADAEFYTKMVKSKIDFANS